MNTTVKRTIGAIAVLASILVAGLQVKGIIPPEVAASIQAILAALGYASPSPAIRTGA